VSLSISVFGLGYVGSVSAACFASMGHQVIGVDVNPAKVETMESGRSPIIEASMSELVAEGHRAGRLHATIDSTAAVLESDGSFVCVGTPSLRNGKLDLSHIEKVAREIGAALKQKKSGHTIVLRSTVLPGTTESMVLPVIEQASGRNRFYGCLQPGVYARGKRGRRLSATAIHNSGGAGCFSSGSFARTLQTDAR